MKKYIILSCMVLGFAACKKSSDFLDNKASAALTEQTVFSDSARTMQFLGRIYQDENFWFNPARFSAAGNTDVATDDMESTSGNSAAPQVLLINGSYGALTNGFIADAFNVPYADIRRVNLLLSELPKTPLAASTQKRVAGEARFLRAWYYYQLIVAFGGVPVIGDKVYQADDIINVPRTNFADCVNYIVKELDDCAQILPLTYQDADYGRVTKGAALALKSRVLLVAASPLFNGGAISITTADVKPVISYPSYDQSRWQKAADAANDVISLNQYQLNVDKTTKPAEPGYGFYSVFLKRVNSEYIFAFYRPNNKDMEVYFGAPSRGGGTNTARPTQNVVDIFPTINGKAITDDIKSATNPQGYDAANPYANRDPRFGYSIIYNGSLYNTSSASNVPVDTYSGAGQDGYPGNITGYFVRKMCDATVAGNSGFTTQRAWPLIRYAEILLNYAEAINEAGQPALAYAKLIALRDRAGINPGTDNLYGLKANMTQAEMRAVIQNERRIELFAEAQRYDDMRRWKIATPLNNTYNKGMMITKTGSTFTYTVINTPTNIHGFTDRNYLFPYLDSEIRKMSATVQNPGY